MDSASGEVRIDQPSANARLVEQVGLLRWRKWAYGENDPTRFIDVSRVEAGDGLHLPMTLVAIDSAKNAVRVVGLDAVDDDVSDAERAGRTLWILGMVVAEEARLSGVGRRLLLGLQKAAAGLSETWLATGEEAVRLHQRCGWAPVEHVQLASKGIATTILTKPTHAASRVSAGDRLAKIKGVCARRAGLPLDCDEPSGDPSWTGDGRTCPWWLLLR